eukprot:2383938-Ditylum_brightwellii.AAC.1
MISKHYRTFSVILVPISVKQTKSDAGSLTIIDQGKVAMMQGTSTLQQVAEAGLLPNVEKS